MSSYVNLDQRQPLGLFEAIHQNSEIFGKEIALTDGQRQISWSTLQSHINLVAKYLFANGIQTGDRCILLSANSLEYIALTLGIAKAGGIAAPLSLLLNSKTLMSLIRDADPRFIFIDNAGNTALRNLIDMDSDEVAKTIILEAGYPGGLKCSDLVNDEIPNLPQSETAFSLIYSSGTTGVPKGIIHSHCARSMYGHMFSFIYQIESESRVYISTPLCSNASWMMFLAGLYVGATLFIVSKFDKSKYIEDTKKQAISHAFLVPTQLIDVYGTKEFRESKNPSVLISAGSKLDASLKQRINDSKGLKLFELYGTSEGVCSVLTPDNIDRYTDSVGRAPTGSEIRIIDINGKELGPTQIGEIVGRGPMVSNGYFKRPELDCDLFWEDNKGHRYVKSGDTGYIKDGFLYLKGRNKDMLVSGGFNVFPIDIETVLREDESILDAAVVAKPDARWGERPYAFVESKQDIDVEVFLDHINKKLNKHQRLVGLRVLSELPRNSLGKVIKPELLSVLRQGASNV